MTTTPETRAVFMRWASTEEALEWCPKCGKDQDDGPGHKHPVRGHHPFQFWCFDHLPKREQAALKRFWRTQIAYGRMTEMPV